MKEQPCTEERFRKDTAKHVMTVVRNDGVHRHIRFKRPRESAYWFDLITWPGTLCIDGDMGTYVFRRIEDMFEFFRTDQDYYNKSGRADKLAINLGYWSEKLQAPKPDAATEYSAEKFAEHVIEAFNAWVEENKPDPENSTADQRSEFDMAKGELWSELENDVLRFANDGEIRSYDAANKFSSAIAPGFNMDDCWEWDNKEYTFDFIWCCYAITWGIQKFDSAITTKAEGTAA